MADGRKSSGSRSGSARKSSGATKSRSSSSSSSRSGSSAKRTAAAKKGGQARGRQQTAKKQADKAASAAAKPAADVSGKSAADLRNALSRSIIGPLNLVMLTRDRIEEVLDDAVSRGRMTADDGQKLAQDLFNRGRKQTNDVLADLEQLLGRSGSGVSGARKRGTDAAGRARRQVTEATAKARSAADPVLAQADRARRAAGVGPAFPITGYDDLTVAQVQSRLGDLSPAELRKIRDYEKRHANRKTILSDIEQRLGT
jgi:polyhydroxyalkanoate synthesis regulator phasin